MQKRQIKIFTPPEIRKIREFFKLTRADFAELFFLTAETVKGWETGRRNQCGPALVIMANLEDEMLENMAETERHRAAGRAVLSAQQLRAYQLNS